MYTSSLGLTWHRQILLLIPPFLLHLLLVLPLCLLVVLPVLRLFVSSVLLLLLISPLAFFLPWSPCVVGPYTALLALTLRHWALRCVVGPYALLLGCTHCCWALRCIVGPYALSLGLSLLLISPLRLLVICSSHHWPSSSLWSPIVFESPESALICRGSPTLIVAALSPSLGSNCWHWLDSSWQFGRIADIRCVSLLQFHPGGRVRGVHGGDRKITHPHFLFVVGLGPSVSSPCRPLVSSVLGSKPTCICYPHPSYSGNCPTK